MDDFTKPLDHVKKTIDERPHIIAVHTHYSDNLRKGEYQLTFGENTGLGLDKGFLVPQSGRIKKVQTKVLYDGKEVSRSIFEGGSIFTIIAIRNTGEVSNLLTYEYTSRLVNFEDPSSLYNNLYTTKYRLDRNPENIPISEDDVINIRTEIDYIHIRDYEKKDITHSYLFTFLLELDPL